MQQSFRFYEQELPSSSDLVVCKLIEADELGIRVTLSEYANFEGFMIWSEFSRRNLRSYHGHFKKGQVEVLEVISVDSERKYVDLSKRQVQPSERQRALIKYHNAVKLDRLVRALANKTEKSVPEIYRELIWVYEDPLQIFRNKQSTIPEKYSYLIDQMFDQYFRQPIYRFRMCISITHYSYGGIRNIKKALKAAQKMDSNLQISLVCSPVYQFNLVNEKEIEESVAFLYSVFDKISDVLRECDEYEKSPVASKIKIEKEPYCINIDECEENSESSEELSDSEEI